MLALAVSSNNKYLASAGRDKRIILWDIATNSFVHSFTGHRDYVTSLAFQRHSYVHMA